MDTQKNNRLLVEFMGAELGNGTDNDPIVYINIPTYYGEQTLSLKMLQYHKRWDWLIPVIERIEENNLVAIYNNKVTIRTQQLELLVEVNDDNLNKREATYKAVIEYINWYNKNK